jgi:hypothetical protein
MTAEQRAAVEAVAMDMHQPYVAATQTALPEATIVFDKFHIAKLAGTAVDQVRRQEAKRLAAAGDDRLKGTRYGWLRNPLNEDREQRRTFEPLRRSNLKTARGWAIQETLIGFFHWAGANLRTTFARIVRRAGVEPWPRLWHSLRASCESNLAQSFPLATVTKWLGNTPSVALRHYVDPTEAAFDRALEWRPEKSGAKSGALGAQKAAQRANADNGDESQTPSEVFGNCESTPLESLRNYL